MSEPDSSLWLRPESSLLVVVDIQERLAAAMPHGDRELCVQKVTTLIRGAGLLGIPVLVTEQYPKGLGPTVAPIEEALSSLKDEARRVEKLEFDACQCEGFAGALSQSEERKTVILAGMEAHICVWQTARGLLARGLGVHVPSDATCSRVPDNRRIAEGLWARAGATVTCTETVLFDLLGRASGDTFKAISKMIR